MIKEQLLGITKGSTVRLLSLDIPWGGESYVGAAYVELQDGELNGFHVPFTDGLLASTDGQRGEFQNSGPIVTSVSSANIDGTEHPPFPQAASEVIGFIADGAGPSRGRAQDHVGPFNSFPHDNDSREAYLKRLWAAFHWVRTRLHISAEGVDLLLVDMPTVPGDLASTCNVTGGSACFRPLETAFGNKALMPGASTGRRDGRIQFPRFQAGNINGCRPAYAVFELARQAFNGKAIVESFPQLALGPLAEFARAYGLPLITRLAAHKSGSAASMLKGQLPLQTQINAFLGGRTPQWIPEVLPVRARADGYDALLGLLPGLVWAGYTPPATAPSGWQNVVILRNLTSQLFPWPTSKGAGEPVSGTRNWIITSPAIPEGINDAGILCLDFSLWA
jgi:hypothetical protein